LNEAVGESNWTVDVQDPKKVLTVSADSGVNEKTVIQALEKAGYTAEKM